MRLAFPMGLGLGGTSRHVFSLNNQQWQVRLRFVGQVKSGTEDESGPRNDKNGDQNEEVELVWILEVWSSDQA